MPIDNMQACELFTGCVRRMSAPGWEAGDIVAPPATPEGGGTVIGGPSFPLVQIICPNCAYVMHFASPRVGLHV